MGGREDALALSVGATEIEIEDMHLTCKKARQVSVVGHIQA